ncbi:type I-E CRISPR-associated protein Cse2/CasB [Herpetosiphon gulosus]|uniref:CRISPR-associated protein Cse2 n=1 Tax=Herpetosiphon gulosus TaxID=1973496 RepID=A0ABP9X705_9CHLR
MSYTLEFMNQLWQLDAGGRARLKRNAGQSYGEARNVYDVFFRMLPHGVPDYAYDDYFLVATLFSIGTRLPREQQHESRAAQPLNPKESFGAALRKEREQRNNQTGSLDRRFNALLDADREQLPFRLRQIVRLLASRQIMINWSQLLDDLQKWDHQDRYIQRRWAEHYYKK